MDLRVQKTQSAIKNAFIQLRAHRALEQISVRELSDLAMISKGTFYLHYHDIYDLSEQLQKEVIASIVNSIEHPKAMLTDPALFCRELFDGFHNQQGLFDILFAGSQSSVVPAAVEASLRAYLGENYPHVLQNPMIDILITFEVEGSYAAYIKHSAHYSYDEVMTALDLVLNAIKPQLSSVIF